MPGACVYLTGDPLTLGTAEAEGRDGGREGQREGRRGEGKGKRREEGEEGHGSWQERVSFSVRGDYKIG